MVAKSKVQYQCGECGASAPKWTGQCPDCQAWNSLLEVVVEKPSPITERFQSLSGGSEVKRLDQVSGVEQQRISTGLSELDRSLGSGLVSGSVILIGGDPGIGKSTLLIQVLAALGQQAGLQTLYVSAEESVQQIYLRAARLELAKDAILVLAENHLEKILRTAVDTTPQVLVIDSIQTVFSDSLQSAPGSVAQVRECAARLVRYAKQHDTAVFLVGHVTKEGNLAGPRVLEHIVDAVLYFEGDGNSRYRLLRAVKNRYGPVNELGVFAMTDKGLKEVNNPSAIFLSGHEHDVAGTAILVTREGTRPLLVEVQALVDNSHLGNPRRVTVGLDQNRLSMLLAVLHRHVGIATFDQDIYVNIVGGVKLTETAADLAVLIAIISSLQNRALDRGLIIFGEIGLSGELRPVQNGQERLKEALQHGYKKALIPVANAPKEKLKGMQLYAVKTLQEAVQALDDI
ncbi:MAG: DNA repair protein RadA [Gammaproteobacteria bacterium]